MASVGTVATVGPVPTGLVVSNQRCRTCMCFKSNQTPLFRRNLSLKVMKLADIKLREDDGLPTTICLDCEIDLERCYGFIAQIQNSDKKLRETLRIPHEIKVQEEPLIVEQQRNCNEPVFDPLAPEAINQYEIKQECIHIESVMDQESYNSNGNQNEHYFESHVEVLEDRLRVENSELAGNYDGQEEPLIEDQQRHCNDRVPDPLNYVKVEADTMNIEPSHIPETPMPGPSTQSPAVGEKVPGVMNTIQPGMVLPEMGNFIGLIQGTTGCTVSASTSGLNHKADLGKNQSLKFTQHHTADQSLNVDQNQQKASGQILLISLPTQNHVREKVPGVTNPVQPGVAIPKMGNFIGVIQGTTDCTVSASTSGLNHNADRGTSQTLNFTQPHSLKFDQKSFDQERDLIRESNQQKKPGQILLITLPTNNSVNVSSKSKQGFVPNISPTANLIQQDKVYQAEHNQPKASQYCQSHYSRTQSIQTQKLVVSGEQKQASGSVINNTEKKQQVIISSDILSFKPDQTFCVACSIEFGSVELLQIHREENLFICRVCTNEFKTHYDLEQHLIRHMCYKCKICKKPFFVKGDLLKHRKTSAACKYGKVKCEICFIMCSSNHSLREHQRRIHKNIGSYKCVVCASIHTNPRQLLEHLKRKHVVYEYCECSYCKKLFLGSKKVEVHIKSAHVDLIDKHPVICPTCGKTFKNKTILYSHEQGHDKTPMLCDICGQSVKGKKAMVYHIQGHNLKSHTCDCCNQTFHGRHQLRRHLLKLKKEKNPSLTSRVYCEICGKDYKTLEVLKRHVGIHSSERPFKCGECGATFKQSAALTLHKRIHNIKNKYCCNSCGDTFRWKQTFDKHVKQCELNSEDP